MLFVELLTHRLSLTWADVIFAGAVVPGCHQLENATTTRNVSHSLAASWMVYFPDEMKVTPSFSSCLGVDTDQ